MLEVKFLRGLVSHHPSCLGWLALVRLRLFSRGSALLPTHAAGDSNSSRITGCSGFLDLDRFASTVAGRGLGFQRLRDWWAEKRRQAPDAKRESIAGLVMSSHWKSIGQPESSPVRSTQ